MAIIGNPIYQSAFVTDQFNGDGTTTAFTMSVAPAGVTNVLVAVSGVLQDPSTYGVVGNTITFSAAPPSGTGNISCRYLGIPVTGVTTTAYRTVTEFTATASQTTFTPPSYTVGFINVYLNGVLLGSADYTATNGTTVVLTTGASAGNLLTVESFLVSSVLNAIPNTAGSVSASNLAGGAALSNIGTGGITSSYIASVSGSTITGSQSIPKAALPTGSVLQVVSASTTTLTSTTSTSFVDCTNITASITPTSSSSKILVLITAAGLYKQSTSGQAISLRVLRGASEITTQINIMYSTTTFDFVSESGFVYLDSPATTSSTTYKLQIRARVSGTVQINQDNASDTSTITLMEIAA